MINCSTGQLRGSNFYELVISQSCVPGQDSRVWVDQPGSALVTDDEIFASVREQWHRSGGGAAGASGRQLDYYALLGVERNAPPEAIKRAYYVLARKCVAACPS